MSAIVTPTTYDMLLEATSKKEQAIKEFKSTYYDYLHTCLTEAGFLNKWVRNKSKDVVGKIEINMSYWSLLHPYELKFYAVTKKGEPSQRATYIPEISYAKNKELLNILVNSFELVGDTYEG